MQPTPPESRNSVPLQQTRAFQTRSALLDAAERVLSRSGIAALTLEQVAREAEMSKGALLYHFRTKDELHLELAQRLCLEFLQEADQIQLQQRGAWTLAALSAIEAGSSKYANVLRIVPAIADVGEEAWGHVNQEVFRRLQADGLDEADQALVYCLVSAFAVFTDQEAQTLAPRVKLAVSRILPSAPRN